MRKDFPVESEVVKLKKQNVEKVWEIIWIKGRHERWKVELTLGCNCVVNVYGIFNLIWI